MGAQLQNNGGPFALTRGKVFLFVSLILTWWLAHMMPHYEPAIKSVVSSRLSEARKKMPSVRVDWHREENPMEIFDATKVALLVEPRHMPHLVPLILHMIYVVPPDWRFVFIGSEKSVKAVGRSFAIQHQQVVGKLDLLTLPPPWEIGSKEMVFRLMTDLRFYNEFLPGVEWILKYESDSILCANSGTSLNEWLEWSWAGSPRTPDDRFAGNGGLSLRKMTAIRKVLEFQARYNDSQPEDEWFGKRLWVLPGEKVASGTDGALAVEDFYIENPMGYHVREGGKNLKPEVWRDQEQRKKIFKYCPELSLIMDMKLDRERCAGDNGMGEIDMAIFDEAQRKKEEEEAKKQEKTEKEEDSKAKEADEAKKAEEEAKAEAEAKAKEGEANAKEVEAKAKEESEAEEKKKAQEALEAPSKDGAAPAPTPGTGDTPINPENPNTKSPPVSPERLVAES